jgi:hypothetical protein
MWHAEDRSSQFFGKKPSKIRNWRSRHRHAYTYAHKHIPAMMYVIYVGIRKGKANVTLKTAMKV